MHLNLDWTFLRRWAKTPFYAQLHRHRQGAVAVNAGHLPGDGRRQAIRDSATLLQPLGFSFSPLLIGHMFYYNRVQSEFRGCKVPFFVNSG